MAAALLTTSLYAGILNDWQFDDAAGTLLNGAANLGSEGANFAGQTEDWETDGNGLIVANSATNYFRNANITEITTGKAYLRLDMDSWDFTGTAGAEQIGFGFRDSSEGSQLLVVKFLRLQDDEVRLQVLDDVGTTTLMSYTAQTFTAGVDVALEVDLDADHYEVRFRTGTDDFLPEAHTGSIGSALAPDQIRFYSQNDFSPAGSFMAADRLYQGESWEDVDAGLGPTPVPSTAVVTRAARLGMTSVAGTTYFVEYNSAADDDGWVGSGAVLEGAGQGLTTYDRIDGADTRVYRISTSQ